MIGEDRGGGSEERTVSPGPPASHPSSAASPLTPALLYKENGGSETLGWKRSPFLSLLFWVLLLEGCEGREEW